MASSQVGDRRGPYVGYTAGSSRRAVMFDTHYATEVRETSGLVPVVGGLGAGKSVLLGQLTYEAVRRGIPSVVLDPSGPLARLTELPELAGTRAPGPDHGGERDPEPVRGGRPPLRRRSRPRRRSRRREVLAAQDRKLLAMDVVKMLLPPSLDAIPPTSLVISDAVRATRGEPTSSLWDVVEHLEGLDDPHGRVVANYLRDMAELPLARLFFPSAGQGQRRLDATLTVLTMPGLVLPPRSVPRDHWSTSEQLAVPLLHLASWYATRAVYGRRCRAASWWPSTRRTSWGSGRPGGRCSPGWAGTPASGTPACSPPRRTRRTCSAWTSRTSCPPPSSAGSRTRTLPATGSGCCGCPPASATSGPSPPCPRVAGPSGFREFVMRDVDGHVDKLRVDLSANPSLLEALNTTAGRDTRRRRRGAGRMTRRLRGPGPLPGGTAADPSRWSAAAEPGAAPSRAWTARSPRPRTARARASRASSRRHRTRSPSGRTRSPRDASTTIYEQYGYAGLRWRTYDLGCGPDAARHPDAVIGTAVSNWIINFPVAWSALTSSLTEVAFDPTFLNIFDPASPVSSALHESLFATWIPAVLALLGSRSSSRRAARPSPPRPPPSDGR